MSGERALAIRQDLGIEKLGTILAQSGYFTDVRQQAQAIVKVLAGAELDFGPIASMNGISIIKGKTVLAANLIAAAIKRSDKYNYRIVQHTADVCEIAFYEDGEKVGSSTFTMTDAKAAGLETGDNWKKFPRNMLFARAMSNGAKWYCPEVFTTGVYTADELGAEEDAEGNVIEVFEAPAAPAEPSTPTREQDVEDADIIRSADDKLWKRWQVLRKQALDLGVPFEDPSLGTGMPRQDLITLGTEIAQAIEERKAQLAKQDQGVTLWERNKALHAEAYALGGRFRELRTTATPDEIDDQNAMLEDWLASRPTAPAAL